MKDELNRDKYIKDAPEDTAQTQEPAADQPAAEQPLEQKPEEPQALTLDEYYKSKGVEISATYEKKEPARRTELDAEWLKKEKLTVLDTKESKKISERNGQNVVKHSSARVGLDENLEGLGFFGKSSRRPEERRENAPQQYKGKGKKIIHEEDFPTL